MTDIKVWLNDLRPAVYVCFWMFHIVNIDTGQVEVSLQVAGWYWFPVTHLLQAEITKWKLRDVTIHIQLRWGHASVMGSQMILKIIFVRQFFFQTDSKYHQHMTAQIAKFMGPRWGPTGSCRPQMGPMLAPWTLLSGWPFWVESSMMTNNAETYPYHAVMYIMHGFTWYTNGEVIGQLLQRS